MSLKFLNYYFSIPAYGMAAAGHSHITHSTWGHLKLKFDDHNMYYAYLHWKTPASRFGASEAPTFR